MKRILGNEFPRIMSSICPYAAIVLLIIMPIIEALQEDEFVHNFAFFYFDTKYTFICAIVFMFITYLIVQMIESVSLAEYIQSGASRKQMYTSMFLCSWITSSIILVVSQFGLAVIMHFIKGQEIFVYGMDYYARVVLALILSAMFYTALMCLIVTIISNIVAVPVIYILMTLLDIGCEKLSNILNIGEFAGPGLILSNLYTRTLSMKDIVLDNLVMFLFALIFVIPGWLYFKRKELR